MLTFKKEQIDAMLDHANELYPLECCGIIAGRGNYVHKIVKLENESRSPVEYSMDALSVKKILEELDAAGLEFLSVYHSHPTSEAYPSAIDIKKALFPEIDYIIISLINRDEPEMKNFKISGSLVHEEPFEILS